MRLEAKRLLLALVPLLLLACGGSQKKSQKLDRAILGEELAFGREAAKRELWNEAIFRWEKVVKEAPDNAQAVNNLAVAYESIGDFERAESLYERAIKLNEDSTEIRKNYKRFLAFYKKHQRQLAREKRRTQEQPAEPNDANEGGDR